MEGHLPLDTSGLNCPLDISNNKLFFSLVDYRNNYFTSNDPNKIIEFYKSFESRDQLIEWMKERPDGTANLYEIEGDKEIIVVIPTADFNGKYAKECRENIFKGLHVVFVESGGKEDFYFNYAHNCNTGIKKAMEYNPKWIVVSNDDMYKIDDVEVLVKELIKTDEDAFDVLFAKKREYVTQISKVAERRFIFKILIFLLSRKYEWTRLENKFGIKVKGSSVHGLSSLLYKKGWMFRNFNAFVIFSFNFCRTLGGNIFDEVYVNAAEDTDLSIRANTDSKSKQLNFQIGAFIGKAFGMSMLRRYREIPSNAYLNFKIETGMLKIGNPAHNLKKT